MSNINGFGTTFYGECDYELDGSYVATKWFILAFIPIIPLFSARVYGVYSRNFITTEYYIEKLPRNWGQVFRTWGFLIFMIFGLILCIGLMAVVGRFLSFGKYLTPFILLGYFIVMWFLPDYWHYKAKLKADFDPDEIQLMSPSAKKTAVVIGILLLIFMGFMAFVSPNNHLS